MSRRLITERDNSSPCNKGVTLRARKDSSSVASNGLVPLRRGGWKSIRTSQVSNRVYYYECLDGTGRAVGSSLDSPVMVAWYILPFEWLPSCPKWAREVYEEVDQKLNE
jgi:hypothetical protein